MTRFVSIDIRELLENRARPDFPEAQALKVIWAVPDPKEAKDFKVLAVRRANQVFLEKQAPQALLEKMDSLATRAVKEKLESPELRVSPAPEALQVSVLRLPSFRFDIFSFLLPRHHFYRFGRKPWNSRC